MLVGCALALTPALALERVDAAFTGTTSTGGNDVEAGQWCDPAAPSISSVQKGTASSTGNGTTSVSISPVDTTESFLLFTIRTSSELPEDATVRGRLASSDSIEFVRVTNTSSPPTISIEWAVISYRCGIKVQHGTLSSYSGTTANATITAVSSTSRAFVLWSRTPATSDTMWNENDTAVSELTTTTNLQFRFGGDASNRVIEYQVVEFPQAGAITKQEGSTSLDGTTTNVTLSPGVDLSRAIVLVETRETSSDSDYAARIFVRARFTSSTNLELYRTDSTGILDEIRWRVIELPAGTYVQRGTASISTSSSSAAASLDPVDAYRTTAIAGMQFLGGVGAGSTTSTDMGPRHATVTMAVSSSTLTLTRGSTGYPADIPWQVIEWGGPRWWNNDYGYRAQATIITTSDDAPAGYSVPVTIDHAALVAAGTSQADGDDVRVAYWNGTAWTELDRVLDPESSWNTATTTIWFKTSAAVATNTTAGGYYLYWGNPAGSSPPASRDNVWLFWDDFETGTLSKWNQPTTALWAIASDQTHGGSYAVKLPGRLSGSVRYLAASGLSTTDIRLDAWWRLSNVGSSVNVAQGVRATTGTPITLYMTQFITMNYTGWGIAYVDSDSYNVEIEPPSGQNNLANTWYRITYDVVGTSTRVLRNGTQLVPSSGWRSMSHSFSSGSVALRARDMPSGAAAWVDDIVVRRLANPEPTVSLAATTSRPA